MSVRAVQAYRGVFWGKPGKTAGVYRDVFQQEANRAKALVFYGMI